jgi:archaellum component FlaC
MALFHEMLVELRGINTRLERVEARLERVENGVERVTQRLDHILEFVGEQYRTHDDRLRRIEAKVFGT